MNLGLVGYQEAWDLQRSLAGAVSRPSIVTGGHTPGTAQLAATASIRLTPDVLSNTGAPRSRHRLRPRPVQVNSRPASGGAPVPTRPVTGDLTMVRMRPRSRSAR